MNILIWNEFYHERFEEAVKAVYPDGMHKAIGAYLARFPDVNVRYATLCLLYTSRGGLFQRIHTPFWGYICLIFCAEGRFHTARAQKQRLRLKHAARCSKLKAAPAPFFSARRTEAAQMCIRDRGTACRN